MHSPYRKGGSTLLAMTSSQLSWRKKLCSFMGRASSTPPPNRCVAWEWMKENGWRNDLINEWLDYMKEWVKKWINGQMDPINEWRKEWRKWMKKWINGQMNSINEWRKWINEWIYEWLNLINEWMKMYEEINEWMNECLREWSNVRIHTNARYSFSRAPSSVSRGYSIPASSKVSSTDLWHLAWDKAEDSVFPLGFCQSSFFCFPR